MLKNILKLDGAQQLSKNEQKTIIGGITKECANAYSNGCNRTINAVDCFNIYDGVYNNTCKCCNI
jgi:hypothetical protein